MRLILAGLLLLIPMFAFAQATGEVESIGFNDTYRPDCWTPMVVRLKPTTADAGTYLLQVWQYDVDGDRPVFTRPITLNGIGQSAEQRFWMYFLPQPINKGLADAKHQAGSLNDGTLKDLQREIKVFICKPDGKQIAQLPITNTLTNVDPFRNYSALPRSSKFILCVTEPGSAQSQPRWADYQNAIGVMEDVIVITLQPKDLPENPLGYEAVDGIVWLNADPASLDRGGEHKLAALQDYVRFGGHLVVCQPTTEWQKVLGFADMLPVDVSGVDRKATLEPLRSMAKAKSGDPIGQTWDVWDKPIGPFSFARATAKPRAVVDEWIDWKEDKSFKDATPYLARGAYGSGQVTWVAQDLGDPAIVNLASSGWPYVWDRVFGWKNDTYVVPANVSKEDSRLRPLLATYLNSGSFSAASDIGAPFADNHALNLESKTAWFIFIAIAFFIVYWIVAGPGGFFYLAGKKKLKYNWFFFGAAALIATLLTAIVVKLVLRGPPDIRHLSFVRVAPGQPAIIYSRFGLYIPRDGEQSLELADASHDSVSCVSGFAEHPQLLGDASEFPSPSEYKVPIRDLAADDAPSISVPYRSSLKKFQTRWVGTISPHISGSVKLTREDSTVSLTGTLANESGTDLTNVYIAYHGGNDRDDDRVIYIPLWKKNVTIDLKKDITKPAVVGHETQLESEPGRDKIISDDIGSAMSKGGDSRNRHWMGFWFSGLSHNGVESTNVDDPGFTKVFPIASFFDRIPPRWNTYKGSTGEWTSDRVDLFRRGARMLNTSQSLTAGQLVILATKTDAPLPMPLEINGDKIEGKGTVFYQFILPIDRQGMDQPSTQPSEP